MPRFIRFTLAEGASRTTLFWFDVSTNGGE